MPLPERFHKDIQVFDTWSSPKAKPQYLSSKRYRAVIDFDVVSPSYRGFTGRGAEAGDPAIAKSRLINDFPDDKLIEESKPIRIVVGLSKEVLNV